MNLSLCPGCCCTRKALRVRAISRFTSVHVPQH